MKILVVDDEKKIRWLFRDMLVYYGYRNVKLASGYKEAVKMTKIEHPDIVFLDIIMPEKNGIQVLKLLKDINPALNVVMMTGYAVDHLIEKAMQMGGVDHIYKPFDINEINMIIDKIKKKEKLKKPPK